MSELHVPELVLRRIFAGELSGGDAETARRHAAECAACKAKLRLIEDEQAKFEQVISLDRFKAGVERSARGTHAGGKSPVGYFALAVAAVLALMLMPVVMQALREDRNNGIKGALSADLVIAPANKDVPQRTVSTLTPELLSPGERVRISYTANGYHYITAISVDDQGEVTPLAPETGLSPKVCDPFSKCALPEAWEFTGKGLETVVVLFSDGPLDMNDVVIATKDAYERSGGKIGELPAVFIPGLQLDQIHRTVLKP